jgi:hypothetical protein
MSMTCVGFKRLERGSLQGFADLRMDSGLVLLGCTFHQSNGKRWVNPPGRPQLDAQKQPIMEGGKIAYAPVIEFVDASTRYKWSVQAVAAIDVYQSKAPTEAGAMNGGKHSEAASLGARGG